MYRIDIPEPKLHGVLQHHDAVSVLANMVYDRQMEKAQSRLKYKEFFKSDDADKDLKW